ncbi:hypothetical protein FS749_012206 [Ceratobasidium sp. UAMH 11750]|nr:hypothetical protein FS749_012206 [Ceratobasidium sp. UAMH 11750]
MGDQAVRVLLPNEVAKLLRELKALLSALKSSLPLVPLQQSKYASLVGFNPDPNLVDDIGEVGAVNTELERIFGHRQRGLKIEERGQAIQSIHSVLAQYLDRHPGDVILQKWLLDVLSAARSLVSHSVHICHRDASPARAPRVPVSKAAIDDSSAVLDPRPSVSGVRPASPAVDPPVHPAAASRVKRPGRPSLEKENARQKKQKSSPGEAAAADVASDEDLGQDDQVEEQVRLVSSFNVYDHSRPQFKPLSQVWGDTITEFFHRLEENHQRPDPDAERIANLVETCRIGGAYIHAFGLGHLYGIVDTDDRRNPRPVTQSQVAKLVKAFLTPGAKSDHHSPIIVMIPRSRIKPSCLQSMLTSDPRNPAHAMPPLELSNDFSVELLQLETCMLSNQENNHWLSRESARDKSVRLSEVYNSRQKAVLLNGNHRIQAILEIGRVYTQRFRDLRDKVQKGLVTQQEVEMEISGSDMMSKVMLASYRVEVYDADKMTNELLNWLVRNEDERPAQGMSAGELAWWNANRFDELVNKAPKDGAVARHEQINWAYVTWARGRALANTEDTQPERSRSKSKSGRKGDWVGPDSISRLFTEPFTMEMVRDTRHALVAYDMCPKTIAIFDVSNAEGLGEAREYISTNQRIGAIGDRSAVEHWDRLHSRSKGRPKLLRFYRGQLSKSFDKLYCAALDASKHPTRNIEWEHGPTVLRFREVFEAVGRETMEREPDWCHRVGLSLRLYTRLPLSTETPDGPVFVPTSALPGENWLKSIQEQYKSLNSEAGMIIVRTSHSPPITHSAVLQTEYAFEQFLPLWTVGAQTTGTSVNSSNWYSRSRALHQFAMRSVDVELPDTINRSLHGVITRLSDACFGLALAKIQADCAEALKTLRERCCVKRSSTVTYTVLEDYAQDFETEFGSFEIGPRKFQMARARLKNLILGDPDVEWPAIAELASEHPVLDIVVPEGFWEQACPLPWVRGWNTSAPRRYQDVNSLLGWAILSKRLEPLFMELMDESRESRYLIRLCQYIEEIRGQPPWWERLELGCDDLPSPPSSVHESEAGPSERKERSGSNVPKLEGGSDGLASPPPSSGGSPPAPNAPLVGEEGREPSRPSPPGSPRAQSKSSQSQGRLPLGDRAVKHLTQPWDIEGSALQGPSAAADGPASSDPPRQPPADNAGDGAQYLNQVWPLIQSLSQPVGSAPSTVTDCPTAPTDLSLREIFDKRLPGHLFTRQKHTYNTLEALLGGALWQKQGSGPRIRRAIQLNHARFDKVMLAIGVERRRMRQSMLAVAQVCVDCPYGGFIADSWLAPTIAELKDIYVTRLALILRRSLDMTLEEAMNEAVAIAATDRLYQIEAKRLDHESGDLDIDLTGTFARGCQAQVGEDAILHLGTVRNSYDDRRALLEAAQYIHAPCSTGRTEAESFAHGIDAAVLMLTKWNHLKNKAPRAYMAMDSLPAKQDPPTTGSSWLDSVPVVKSTLSRWDVRSFKPEPLSLTRPVRKAGFATGRFNQPWDAPDDHLSEELSALRRRAKKVAATAEDTWEKAQQLDILSYEQFVESWRNKLKFPTQDYTGIGTQPPASSSQEVPGSIDGEGLTVGSPNLPGSPVSEVLHPASLPVESRDSPPSPRASAAPARLGGPRS